MDLSLKLVVIVRGLLSSLCLLGAGVVLTYSGHDSQVEDGYGPESDATNRGRLRDQNNDKIHRAYKTITRDKNTSIDMVFVFFYCIVIYGPS